MTLDGASVLVTGGTRGIGLAIALRLVADGASRAVLGYMRNDNAAGSATELVRGAGAEPVLVRGNVSSARVIAELAAAGRATEIPGVGKTIAEKCLQSGIQQVIFDRNGFLYHGRVRALADAILFLASERARAIHGAALPVVGLS